MKSYFPEDAGAERLFVAVITTLQARTDLDGRHIGFYGLSFGGYWAVRLALAERQVGVHVVRDRHQPYPVSVARRDVRVVNIERFDAPTRYAAKHRGFPPTIPDSGRCTARSTVTEGCRSVSAASRALPERKALTSTVSTC